MNFKVIRLRCGDVAVEVVPERGAIVASLQALDKDMLYLDRASLEDPTKNVRGGIPLLFPFAGKLIDDRLLAAGTHMNQHGFGRNRPWAVEESTASELRLKIVPNEDTRAQFPYDYEVQYRVAALPRGVELRLLVESTGTTPIPLSPGWHPYFRCPHALKSLVVGNVEGFSSDKLGDDREFDFGLIPPQSGRTNFEIPELGSIRVDFSPTMRHMQFWSQPGKDFICLEPFYGPNNTLNTPRRLDVLAGQVAELWMRIELNP